MTNPVITAGAASLRTDAATAGITLWGASNDSFSSGDSRSMCEMVNMTKESIDRAAQADKILCYIQNTIVAPVNAGAFVGDPYDGNYHTVTLNFGGTNPNPNSSNTAPKMKFKVVKSGDKILEFEFFMCMSGTAEVPIQDQYLHEVIDGDGNVTITSKETSNWKSHMTVSGKIDSSSQFTQKTITALSGGTDSQCTNAQKAVLEQFSDSMEVSAYQKGECNCSGCGAYANQAFSVFQLINGTSSDLHTLAVGEGSLKALFGGTGSGSASDSWDGDTKKDLASWTSGTYYSSVNAGAYPTTDPTIEVAAIAFTAAETWDCATASEGTMTVDMAGLDPICSVLGLRHDDGTDSWIDCWGITQ
jgi:hypothetical protein